MSVLTRQNIERLMQQKPPLVTDYVSLEQQLQPNGIDLTVREIASAESAGTITVDNGQRKVSQLAALPFDNLGFVYLSRGAYIITFNEVVNLPRDLMALARPRSSLLRCGVSVPTAVWDAGYSGRSQSLLVVHNPAGFRLEKNARIVQLVFFKLTGATEGYQGAYQFENT